MFRANATNTATTTTRLIKAMDRQHPVTLTYTEENGDIVVRTVEIYDFAVSEAGNVLVKLVKRGSGEHRTYRLDRITAYTVHRTRYLMPREDTVPTRATLNHPGDPNTLLTADAAPVDVLADLLSD